MSHLTDNLIYACIGFQTLWWSQTRLYFIFSWHFISSSLGKVALGRYLYQVNIAYLNFKMLISAKKYINACTHTYCLLNNQWQFHSHIFATYPSRISNGLPAIYMFVNECTYIYIYRWKCLQNNSTVISLPLHFKMAAASSAFYVWN